jgi:hypothetical protein
VSARPLACALCGSQRRHRDDLYRLRVKPDERTLARLRAGLSVAELAEMLRVRKVCAGCRSGGSPGTPAA